MCPELSIIPKYAKNTRLMGPQMIAESAMRDLSRADLALPSAEVDAEQLQGICPVDIPFYDLAEFLIRLEGATRNVPDTTKPKQIER